MGNFFQDEGEVLIEDVLGGDVDKSNRSCHKMPYGNGL